MQMSSKIAVRALNLSKEYYIYSSPQKRFLEILFGGKREFHRKFSALKTISFEIEEGTSVGIVGRNGSGKSTLLQMIAGTLTPTSGTIQVNGKIAALLELGSGFNPEFTGRENVYLYGSIMQMSQKEINQRIEEIISFADIGDFIDQPIKTYSSGMHVRLAFSAAIHINPDILLIDEALAVGDPAFQLKCFEKINDFRKNGKTIIFVSHDINIISQFCDRVLVLSGGELSFDGKPMEGLNIYKAILFSGGKIKSTKGVKKTEANISNSDKGVALNKQECRSGTAEAEIFQIRIINQNGQSQQVFLSSEETSIIFSVRALSYIKEPVYGIIIKNKEGLQVYGKNSLHQRISCPPLKKGDIQEIHFRQRLYLNANDYFLTVGVAQFQSGEMISLDRRSDVVQFKIVGTEDSFGIANLNSIIELK